MSDIVPWQNPQTNPHRPPAKAIAGLFGPHKPSWLRAWWPALLWAGVIFLMSTDAFSADHTRWFLMPVIHWLSPSLAPRQIDVVHHFIRKSAHFIEYFIFCVLLFRAFRGEHEGWQWSWGFSALFVAAGYSILDEIHQAFVASRTASPYDSLLDSAGASVAFGVLWLWLRARRDGANAEATQA